MEPSIDASASAAPSMAVEANVISDVQEIQQAMNALPQDLLNLILALEGRMQQLESVVQSLVGSSTTQSASPDEAATVTSISPTSEESNVPIPVAFEGAEEDIDLPPASPGTAPELGPPPHPISITDQGDPPPVPSATDLCDSEAGTPLPAACQSSTTTTRTTTSTTTITRTTTITTSGTLPYQDSISLPNSSSQTLNLATATGVQPEPVLLPNSTGEIVTYSVSFVPYSTLSQSVTALTVSAPSSTSAPIWPLDFDPNARDNLAVYYGSTPATQDGGLSTLCRSSAVDIVILSFVFDFFGPGNFPSFDFGPGCSGSTPAQKAAGATGLSDCSDLAKEIVECQGMGKKVLLSLGGYVANTTFTSDQQAIGFASQLWDLFGAGNGSAAGLRPFGADVVIDGFDIDNENHNTAHYAVFAWALRSHFDTDQTKTYYLSCAPQCPIPDESIPLQAMAMADFVWVQFYNNPACELGSDGFESSFAAWSRSLDAARSSKGKPKLFIGMAASSGAGTGYIDPLALKWLLRRSHALEVDDLGGIMLWDGSEALANVDQNGADYLLDAKGSLHGDRI